MLAPIVAGLLALAAPPPPPNVRDPDVNYVVVSNDRDRASCPGGAFQWSMYFNVKRHDACYAFPDMPKMTSKMLVGGGRNTSRMLSPNTVAVYTKVAVSDAGISFIYYDNARCQGSSTGAAPNMAFGACVQPPGYTYSVRSWRPRTSGRRARAA